MNRRTFMQTQQRAYVYGHVEYMNDEWVFFDDEDEAHTLAHIEEEVELFAYDQWIKGV